MKRNYENFQATDIYRTLSENLSDMPFSFVYNGKEYKGFSPEHFTLISKNIIRSDEKKTRIFKLAFLQTLEVSLILTHYYSHGVTEWTVWFENTSDKNSRATDGTVTLHFDAPRTARLLWVNKI